MADGDEHEENDKILIKQKATLSCPRCGERAFTLSDGYVRITVGKKEQEAKLGGPGFDARVTVCNNCGNVQFHHTYFLRGIPINNEEPNNG